MFAMAFLLLKFMLRILEPFSTTEPFEQISSLYGEKIKIIIYQDVLCFHIQMIEMERSSALRTWGLVSDSQNIKEHEHA